MIGELVQFGVVILVVMLGFAVSFHALYSDVDTFGHTFLTLFKGMLGEVGFFDDFPNGDYNEYEEVATALFVVYLAVIAIILLNLLVAVLSTSHAKVHEKAEQEFRVTTALFIDRYRLVVDKHLLPPPFNWVQMVLSLPFYLAERSWYGSRCSRAKEAVGRAVFWLVMGMIGVIGGTVLWVASAVYAPFAWHKRFGEFMSSRGIAFRYPIVFAWCVVGAPVYLVVFWLTSPFKWFGLRPWNWLWDHRELPFDDELLAPVDEMLVDSLGGLSVAQLQDLSLIHI